MIDVIGWVVTIVLVVLGVNVLYWLLTEDWFSPGFPRHHKTQVPTTRTKE